MSLKKLLPALARINPVRELRSWAILLRSVFMNSTADVRLSGSSSIAEISWSLLIALNAPDSGPSVV
jgi:hypothetical protein